MKIEELPLQGCYKITPTLFKDKRGEFIKIFNRKDSSTFKRNYQTSLSSENARVLYLPKGIAHGYYTIEDSSIMLYMIDHVFHDTYGLAQHEVFGVSSGSPIRLKDLVATYERILDVSLDVEFGSRPYRPREMMIPWTCYKTLPGWAPRISLEDGLRMFDDEK